MPDFQTFLYTNTNGVLTLLRSLVIGDSRKQKTKNSHKGTKSLRIHEENAL